MFCTLGLFESVEVVCEVAGGRRDAAKPVDPNTFLPSGLHKPTSQMIKSAFQDFLSF